ncbi:MAG: hypothetical protein NTY29_02935 [Proteobacteria bacterium]|nr:hypothetical protein [Pseudomonadota bacterium]
MSGLIYFLCIVNSAANTVCGLVFAPIAMVPGWLSITIISAILGIPLFIIFKYTSNQRALTRTIDDIKANLLAVRLYRDNIAVTMKSEARLMLCSVKLFVYSLIPVLIMSIPLSLILAQMGLWYQARPLQLGDAPVVVNLKLNNASEHWPDVTLDARPGARIVAGPMRIASRKEVCWTIQPVQAGNHLLKFQVGDQQIVKQLAIGTGFMRVSAKRPGTDAADVIMHPLEQPLSAAGPVASISIAYPARHSFMCGTDWWLVWFCIISMISALLTSPFIKGRLSA